MRAFLHQNNRGSASIMQINVWANLACRCFSSKNSNPTGKWENLVDGTKRKSLSNSPGRKQWSSSCVFDHFKAAPTGPEPSNDHQSLYNIYWMEQNGKAYFTGFPETYKHLSPMEINPEIQLAWWKLSALCSLSIQRPRQLWAVSVLQITRSKG